MSDVEARIEQWRADLAGSESLRQSNATELQAHLREEMERLKTAGLRDDEAFLIARRRLGDTDVLKERPAAADPRQLVSNRLYWMILGILSYYVLGPLGRFLSLPTAYLAYHAGLRGAPLAYFDAVADTLVYVLIVYLLMRYVASHWRSRIMTKGIVGSICVGVLAASVNLLSGLIAGLVGNRIWSWFMRSTEHQVTTLPEVPGALVWCATMMFLFAGTLAVFSRRSRTE